MQIVSEQIKPQFNQRIFGDIFIDIGVGCGVGVSAAAEGEGVSFGADAGGCTVPEQPAAQSSRQIVFFIQ